MHILLLPTNDTSFETALPPPEVPWLEKFSLSPTYFELEEMANGVDDDFAGRVYHNAEKNVRSVLTDAGFSFLRHAELSVFAAEKNAPRERVESTARWFFSHACETTVFGCILLAGMAWGFDGKTRTLSDKNIFEIPYVDAEGRPSGIACVSLKRKSLGYKNAPSDTRCFSETGRGVKSAFLLRARHMEKSRAAAKSLKLESSVSWFSEHATHERENDGNQGPLDIVSLATECALKVLTFDPDGLNSMRRLGAGMKFTIPLWESNIVASVFSVGIPLTTAK